MNLYSRLNARRSLFHTAVFRVLAQGATMLGYVVMVRGMSESDFGVFNLLYAILPVMSVVASLGLEHVLRRYQPEYLSTGQVAAADWLVRFVGRARFFTNVTFILLVYLTWNLVAPIFDLGPYRNEFVLFSALILLFFQMAVLQLSLSSHMLHKHAMGMQAALAVAKLFGYIGFAFFSDLTLINAILVDTVAHGVSYAGLYLAHRRYCLPPASAESFKLDPDERKRLLKYGFFYNFNDAGTLALNSRLENFFVAAIMGPLAVGAYAFYSRLYIMTNRLLPVSMFQNVVQPVIFAVPKAHAPARLPGYFSFLVDTNVLLQLPITAFAVAYHKEIVEVVFGSRFIEDSLLMPLVFLFAVINVIATPVTIIAQYEEKAAVVLLSRVFGAYNIGALLLLIPILGVYGAAIATGSAEAMKNFFIWWHVRHTARWINWKSALLSGVLLWSGFVLVCIQIRAYFPLPSLAHLGIGGALSIVVFAVYLRTPALSGNDRILLASLVKNRGERLLRLAGVLPARG